MQNPLLLSGRPIEIIDSIADGIKEYRFLSKFDGKSETFLLKDFRTTPDFKCSLLVIYLHGGLAHQEQGMTAGIYEDAFGKWGKELARRQAVYVCPEYRGGSWMGPDAESGILEMIHLLRAHYQPARIILTGASMGGTSALIFAGRNPREIDGVIALCPGSDVSEMYEQFSGPLSSSYGGSPAEIPEEYRKRNARLYVQELATLPMVIVHGEADNLISVRHSRILYESLRQKESRVLYREQKGGHHDSPLLVDLGECLDFVLSEPFQDGR